MSRDEQVAADVRRVTGREGGIVDTVLACPAAEVQRSFSWGMETGAVSVSG